MPSMLRTDAKPLGGTELCSDRKRFALLLRWNSVCFRQG